MSRVLCGEDRALRRLEGEDVQAPVGYFHTPPETSLDSRTHTPRDSSRASLCRTVQLTIEGTRPRNHGWHERTVFFVRESIGKKIEGKKIRLSVVDTLCFFALHFFAKRFLPVRMTVCAESARRLCSFRDSRALLRSNGAHVDAHPPLPPCDCRLQEEGEAITALVCRLPVQLAVAGRQGSLHRRWQNLCDCAERRLSSPQSVLSRVLSCSGA